MTVKKNKLDSRLFSIEVWQGSIYVLLFLCLKQSREDVSNSRSFNIGVTNNILLMFVSLNLLYSPIVFTIYTNTYTINTITCKQKGKRVEPPLKFGKFKMCFVELYCTYYLHNYNTTSLQTDTGITG